VEPSEATLVCRLLGQGRSTRAVESTSMVGAAVVAMSVTTWTELALQLRKGRDVLVLGESVPQNALSPSHTSSNRTGGMVQARLCPAPVMALRERRDGK